MGPPKAGASIGHESRARLRPGRGRGRFLEMPLQASVTGGVSVKPAPGVTPTGSSGCQFGLGLRTENAGPQAEISQSAGILESPGSFQSQPFQTGLQARFLYIRMSSSSSIQIELTQLTTGVTVIAGVLGMFMTEFGPEDPLTALRLQGSASYEWVAFGPVV